MTISSESRIARFKVASLAQVYFYSDPEAGEILAQVSTKYGIQPDQYPTYIEIVGDVILNFYQPEELLRLFIENLHLSEAEATLLTNDIMNFLRPLQKLPVVGTGPTTYQIDGAEKNDISGDIAQAEAELAHVVSVRTMARDMHDLQSQDANDPVHRSTQPAVRAPAPLPVPPTQPTAPKPAPSAGTGPRWDSEEN